MTEQPAPLFVKDDELHQLIAPHIGRERFLAAIRALEGRGFPLCNTLFRGRYFPAVRAWLDQNYGVASNGVDSITAEDGPENFDAAPQRPPRVQAREKQPVLLDCQPSRTQHFGIPRQVHPPPVDATEDDIGHLCREHTARLFAWIESCKSKENEGGRYDGTVYSACRIYQTHPYSRFHKVKANTRDAYVDSLKIIEATVGKRLIRNLNVLDIQNWYDNWRRPAKPGGPERIDRSHDAVSMFKTVLAFHSALGRQDCKELLDKLRDGKSLVRFERGGAREEEMTYQHARAFIQTALDLEGRGVLPQRRGLYMAIGVAAQFELMVRQKDIIGERPKTQDDLDNALARGAVGLDGGEAPWVGWFTWENIPGWRWIMRTSKSKYRSKADFDLTRYGLLFPLLEQLPHSERRGAIVKGERGLPVQERSYRKWFRQIARAANIPDEVWSMDARAGGATEAEEALVDTDIIQGAMTHAKKDTTLRYIRRNRAKIAAVADARSKARAENKP